MPLDQRLRSDLSPIPGMWQKVFLNKAFLLASRDSVFSVRMFFVLWLRTYHNSEGECKNFVRRRKLPVTEETSLLFKSGSSQILPISQDHDEQVPLLRWESRQEASALKFKAETDKGLKCSAEPQDGR